MFISADQILAHLIGDYLLQSDWMANEKVKRSSVAAVHVLLYGASFWLYERFVALLSVVKVFLGGDAFAVDYVLSWRAFAFIVVTHFVIDRWRLARYVVWAKNFIAPLYRYADWKRVSRGGRYVALPVTRWGSDHNRPWRDCTATGYSPDRPVWLTTWLLIIADNTLHLICNGIALRFL